MGLLHLGTSCIGGGWGAYCKTIGIVYTITSYNSVNVSRILRFRALWLHELL